MKRSTFAALVVGTLGGLGAQLALAQPIVPGSTVSNVTATGTVKAALVDAGNVNVAGRLWSPLVDAGAAYVANNLGVGGLEYVALLDAGAANVANNLTVGGTAFFTGQIAAPRVAGSAGCLMLDPNATGANCSVGYTQLAPGTGTGTVLPGGLFDLVNVAVGNVGASGPDDLQTTALGANMLVKASRGLRITAWGTCANTANAKTFTLNFGSQVVLTHACVVNVASQWKITTRVVRTGASTQDWASEYTGNSGAVNAFEYDPEIGTASQSETAGITIKMQSTVSTSNNDIVEEGLLVEFL